ncbi:hypothetical protein E2562_018201 [Oryza meyeriana var. granulata]|uniref:Uncharacterized protein n=1 Tax=Oryza meyeriana var. granulata TaxID=110450 RepID=A0A6G1C7H1_9ORYZ|nr:hypothetical protein E2562_018201 [Oryza meyeriana var. granulata]
MANAGFPLLPTRIVCAAFFAFCACFPGLVAGIRKDIGLAAPIMCRYTVQGWHLISDDNGSTPAPLFCSKPQTYCLTKDADVLKLKK